MGRKGIMGKGKRAVLLFLAVFLTALAAGCVAAVFANSFITVEGSDGAASYLSPLWRRRLCLKIRRFLTIFLPGMFGM